MNTLETLKTTLQDSAFTWDYFTDFEKVKRNVRKIEKELNLLNYLIGKENIEEEFLSLIEEYPKVRKVLPVLIAIRDNKLSTTPIITDMSTLIPEDKRYIFNDDMNENIKKELLIFFKETGLKKFFENKAVKNLVDYCIGVEVGFDTNARKNRKSNAMEHIIKKYFDTYCSNIWITDGMGWHIKLNSTEKPQDIDNSVDLAVLKRYFKEYKN